MQLSALMDRNSAPGALPGSPPNPLASADLNRSLQVSGEQPVNRDYSI